MVNLQCKAITRLESLDILCGLDLFLSVFFQPVFMALVSKVYIWVATIYGRLLSCMVNFCKFLNTFFHTKIDV